MIFLSSSMAEHSAVNRRVVGSSPTWGARVPLRDERDFLCAEKGRDEGFLHLTHRFLTIQIVLRDFYLYGSMF